MTPTEIEACKVCLGPIEKEWRIKVRSRRPIAEKKDPVTTCSRVCTQNLKARMNRALAKAAKSFRPGVVREDGHKAFYDRCIVCSTQVTQRWADLLGREDEALGYDRPIMSCSALCEERHQLFLDSYGYPRPYRVIPGIRVPGIRVPGGQS
jgi:hypothetical protein